MRLLGQVLLTLTWIAIVLLMFRAVVSWVMVLARDWRPAGMMVVLLEAVFTVTDPPLRFLRRFIPLLRVGNSAIDLGFIVLLVALFILTGVWPRLGSS
ncbi:MAG: YggT family protein [Frankiales bacterium]|jgi:YggT family protein|nr:YggT family protein [Frankiales bacterium]MDX6244764.1 YggT family protein [Frankiales bacterium]